MSVGVHRGYTCIMRHLRDDMRCGRCDSGACAVSISISLSDYKDGPVTPRHLDMQPEYSAIRPRRTSLARTAIPKALETFPSLRNLDATIVRLAYSIQFNDSFHLGRTPGASQIRRGSDSLIHLQVVLFYVLTIYSGRVSTCVVIIPP